MNRKRKNQGIWKETPRAYALRISEELYKKIENEHWEKKKSMNQVINDILEEHFSNE